jgi:hypothetical protein
MASSSSSSNSRDDITSKIYPASFVSHLQTMLQTKMEEQIKFSSTLAAKNQEINDLRTALLTNRLNNSYSMTSVTPSSHTGGSLSSDVPLQTSQLNNTSNTMIDPNAPPTMTLPPPAVASLMPPLMTPTPDVDRSTARPTSLSHLPTTATATATATAEIVVTHTPASSLPIPPNDAVATTVVNGKPNPSLIVDASTTPQPSQPLLGARPTETPPMPSSSSLSSGGRPLGGSGMPLPPASSFALNDQQDAELRQLRYELARRAQRQKQLLDDATREEDRWRAERGYQPSTSMPPPTSRQRYTDQQQQQQQQSQQYRASNIGSGSGVRQRLDDSSVLSAVGSSSNLDRHSITGPLFDDSTTTTGGHYDGYGRATRHPSTDFGWSSSTARVPSSGHDYGSSPATRLSSTAPSSHHQQQYQRGPGSGNLGGDDLSQSQQYAYGPTGREAGSGPLADGYHNDLLPNDGATGATTGGGGRVGPQSSPRHSQHHQQQSLEAQAQEVEERAYQAAEAARRRAGSNEDGSVIGAEAADQFRTQYEEDRANVLASQQMASVQQAADARAHERRQRIDPHTGVPIEDDVRSNASRLYSGGGAVSPLSRSDMLPRGSNGHHNGTIPTALSRSARVESTAMSRPNNEVTSALERRATVAEALAATADERVQRAHEEAEERGHALAATNVELGRLKAEMRSVQEEVLQRRVWHADQEQQIKALRETLQRSEQIHRTDMERLSTEATKKETTLKREFEQQYQAVDKDR